MVAWQEHRRVAGRRALFASDPPSHVMHLLKLQCIAFQCMQMRIQLCNLTARIIMNLHHLTYMRAPHIFRERASANLCKRAFQLHVDCRLPQNCSLCNVILWKLCSTTVCNRNIAYVCNVHILSSAHLNLCFLQICFLLLARKASFFSFCNQ